MDFSKDYFSGTSTDRQATEAPSWTAAQGLFRMFTGEEYKAKNKFKSFPGTWLSQRTAHTRCSMGREQDEMKQQQFRAELTVLAKYMFFP